MISLNKKKNLYISCNHFKDNFINIPFNQLQSITIYDSIMALFLANL